MTVRGTAWVSPLVLAVLLSGCTPVRGGANVQPTEPPPTPLTSPSGSSTGPGSAGSAPSSSPPSPTAEPSGAPTRLPAGYTFPVRSAAAARFGRAHHDYPATDIFARCGTDALAATDGVVAEVSRRDEWTARVDNGATRGGLSVSIVGTDGVRYYGSHLSSIRASVVPGRAVRRGDVLGRVGNTGSARGLPCHLHFGISPPCAKADWWNRRGVLSPYPFLASWQKGDQRSPVAAVAGWRTQHGCPPKPAK